MDRIKCLDNPIIVQAISDKLPSEGHRDQYVLKKIELLKKGKSQFEVLSTFMVE